MATYCKMGDARFYCHCEYLDYDIKLNKLSCVSNLDQDGDKKLTLSEFISLPMGTVENQQAQEIDDDWVRERRKEFQEVIDINRDGIVTMDELEVGEVFYTMFQ